MTVIFLAKDKSNDSLFPYILTHAEPNSTIYSDKMATYISRNSKSHIEPKGFVHKWVNHSQNWVDPFDSNTHTNNIERTWRSLNSYISYINRSMDADILEDYINSFILKINCSPEVYKDVLFEILRNQSLEHHRNFVKLL